MTSRTTHLLGLLALAVGTLGGCASNVGPPPPVTVTVLPTGTEAPSPATSTSIPTVAGTTSTSAPSIPPQLSAGHGRGATTSFAAAQALLAAAKAAPTATGTFTSPTANIFCTIAAGAPVIGCEIKDGRVAPPAPMTCPAVGGATDIGRVELRPEGAVPVCNSDTIRVDGAPVLPYGSKIVSAGSALQCASETMGVTCVDTATKRGFFIAKGTFTTF